ncbi:MAG TPA: hypothetical protein VIK91_21385 [Nannocystis sp.]
MPHGSQMFDRKTAAELHAVVSELREVVVRLRAGGDGESGDFAFACDPGALFELRSRFPLPPVCEVFLRDFSSHDFVDSGLLCAGETAWIAPVDTVAELTACCEGAAARRVVCGVSARGHYVLDLPRTRGVDCPVLHVDEHGHSREVAGSFLEFLKRVARESSSRHGVKNMSQKSVEEAEERARRGAGAWMAAAAIAVVCLVVCVVGVAVVLLMS